MTIPADRALDRLTIILEKVEGGATQHETAAAIGVSRGALRHFLYQTTGSDGWPQAPERIRRAIAAASKPAPVRPARRSGKETAFRIERAALRAVDIDGDERGRLSPEAIARRVDEARAARAAHENFHLAMERSRHGLTTQTRVGPLSGMPI